MPYQQKLFHLYYWKGYYAGWRRALIYVLGGKCSKCGSTKRLELDHIKPIRKKPRSLADLKDVSNLRVLCHKCNIEEEVNRQ